MQAVLEEEKNALNKFVLRDDEKVNVIENEVVEQVVAPDDSGGGAKSPVQFAPPGNERQGAIVGALQHAWAGYKKYAWGHDHLKPISKSYHDWFGLGLSIVDGLDTIYLMGLTDGKCCMLLM